MAHEELALQIVGWCSSDLSRRSAHNDSRTPRETRAFFHRFHTLASLSLHYGSLRSRTHFPQVCAIAHIGWAVSANAAQGAIGVVPPTKLAGDFIDNPLVICVGVIPCEASQAQP